jgi:hypothetical protein
MGNREARARRALARPLVRGGVLLAIVVAGLLLLRPSLMAGQQLGLGTSNVMGRASAPVEVEEWSDFQ